MEFKAEINLEYEDFLKWNKVYARTSKKKTNRIYRILLIVLSVLMLISLTVIMMNGEMDSSTVFMVILFIIAVAVLLFKDRINAKASQKQYLKGAGTQYVTFDDESIKSKNLKSEGTYYYTSLTAIYTDGDRFFMLIDDRHALLLPKRSITEGDPESFAGFISEKTGLSVVMIDV